MCLFAMMAASLSAKAQEVTIDLYPGWTWISYPKAEVLDVNTALGDFVPAEGDMIQSQYSNSKYIRGRWVGGVTHFMPGWGYKYFSNREEVVSFVFGETGPQLIVTTAEPTEITATSALSGGEVIPDDGVYILAKGICWAIHENPTINVDYFLEDESGPGNFTASLTELSSNTKYYVRAYAVSPYGITYGEEFSFTTLPIVITSEVTNISYTSATVGGEVINFNVAEILECGICWSINQNPTISDNHIISNMGTGLYSINMTELTASTLYYVKAYAVNEQGISYGQEVTFCTYNNNIVEDWLYYDDGTYATSIGVGGGTIYWASMFPKDSLSFYTGANLTKIALYENNYNTDQVTVRIYIGGTNAPGTLVSTMNYYPEGGDAFHEVDLTTPVVIDGVHNLWVVFSENGTYPANACADTGDANNRWVSLDGAAWYDVAVLGVPGYGWMIRGYVTNGFKEYELNPYSSGCVLQP